MAASGISQAGLGLLGRSPALSSSLSFSSSATPLAFLISASSASSSSNGYPQRYSFGRAFATQPPRSNKTVAAAVAQKQKELAERLARSKERFIEEAKLKATEEPLPVYGPVRKPLKPKYPRQVKAEKVKEIAEQFHERWQKERLEEEFVQGVVEARTRARFLEWKAEEEKRLAVVKEERRKYLEELNQDRLRYREAREKVLEKFRLGKQKLEERARQEFLQILREDTQLWQEHPSEIRNRPFYVQPTWDFDRNH